MSKAAIQGLLGIKVITETYDAIMAEAITERFLSESKESYILIEQFLRGDIAPAQFLERFYDLAATHAVNIEEDKLEEIGA